MNIRTVLLDMCSKSWRTTVLGVSTPNKDPFIMIWYEYTYHFTGSVQEYPARGPEPLEDIVAFSTVQEYPARCPKPLEDIVALSTAFSPPTRLSHAPHDAKMNHLHKSLFHQISSLLAHLAALLRLRPFLLAATSRTSFAATDWSRCRQPPAPLGQPPASPHPASHDAAARSVSHPPSA